MLPEVETENLEKRKKSKIDRKRKPTVTVYSSNGSENPNKKIKQISKSEATCILQEIKNSSKNIYFRKSKKYKPAKLNELNFEFDFSLFNSNCPYYPKALDDINSKINRDRSFWKTIL